MIFDSIKWKQDLIRRKYLLKKYNTAERLNENFDSTYTVIEKSIFYSAFVIRKLNDTGMKLSDEACDYQFHIKRIKACKHFDITYRWLEEDSHDWSNEENIVEYGRNICNWLIHSYLFFLDKNETDTISNFLVSSDYDKNKFIYKISFDDWLDYMSFIISDDVCYCECQFDHKKCEYVYTNKKRRKNL